MRNHACYLISNLVTNVTLVNTHFLNLVIWIHKQFFSGAKPYECRVFESNMTYVKIYLLNIVIWIHIIKSIHMQTAKSWKYNIYVLIDRCYYLHDTNFLRYRIWAHQNYIEIWKNWLTVLLLTFLINNKQSVIWKKPNKTNSCNLCSKIFSVKISKTNKLENTINIEKGGDFKVNWKS